MRLMHQSRSCPIKWAKVLIALACLIAGQFLALAHALHHEIHDDSNSTDHHCPLTLLASSGLEIVPQSCVATKPGLDFQFCGPVVEISFHSEPSSLTAGRSPPPFLP